MSQETYKQLRVEFQKLREQYEQNKGPKFSIQICAPGHWNTADPPYDTEKFQPITAVCLPFEDGYMPNPIQNEEVSLFGVALVPKAKKTKQACTRFVELGGTAGVHLPGQITHQLKGLSSDLLDDPLSKWLALLIVLNGNHSGNSVIVRPFLNSIEAIDRCGLTEDKPYPEALKRAGISQNPSQPGSAAKEPRGLLGKKEKQIKWVAEAMLLVQDHPDWPDAQIAEAVGKHKSTLSRNQTYRRAAATTRGSMKDRHRGHRTVNPDTGQLGVEAYTEDPDWDE
jgi:hypothetical protein